MHISWFLWGSHAGEKWTGLNQDFVSCYTSVCQPVSHELVKSWGDVVAGAGFETAFSNAEDWQKRLMIVSVHEHARGCPSPLFTPGTGAISSGHLLTWHCTCRRTHRLWKHHFPPEHCWALLGEGRGHMEISHDLWAASWTTVNRSGLILPHEHRQKEAILPSEENSRTLILLFPNKEILGRILV